MKRKSFFVLLLLTLLPMAASAYDAEVDGISYNLDREANTAEVAGRGINSESEEVVIPEEILVDGTKYTVTRIGYYAFFGSSELTSVTIPNSVTSIGHQAFYACSNLISITIPNSVITIESSAFGNCFSLKSVSLSNSLTSIGYHAFDRCSSLTSITIPNSVITIESYAFTECTGLTSISIPNSVKTIEEHAFDQCSSLTSVTIPNSVTTIGVCAFAKCSGLTSITIPNSITTIESGVFSGCSSLTSVTIPNSVTTIGVGAFAGCSGLTSFDIPNSVTSIEEKAFSGCSSMASITIPNCMKTISKNAFWKCSSLTSVHISDMKAWCNILFEGPDSNPLCNAHHLYMNGKEIKDLVIPDGVTTICQYAFHGCNGLNSVTISNSVTTIGICAFENCSGMTTVTIPNSVKTIEGGAFLYCSGLTSVHISDIKAWCMISFDGTNSNPFIYAHHLYMNGEEVKDLVIPDGTTTINHDAFEYCTGLTSVSIPNSVTSIDFWAFFCCTGLKSVTIGNGVTTISESAFRKCTGLISATIGNSVRTIESEAFADCTSLASISIPNSVTSIEEKAFNNCSGLTSVIIGDGVTSIGERAFYDCKSLASVSFGNSVSSIREKAFYNCNSLTSVHISDMKAWCNILFETANSNPLFNAQHLYMNGKEIKDLVIPNGVTTINQYAFRGCNGLTSVTVPYFVKTIGGFAFADCMSLKSLRIGNSVTSIGDRAFFCCSGLTSVIIEATEVPYTSSDPFYWVNLDQVSLYVPKDCVDKYAAVEPWKDFGKIVEIEDEHDNPSPKINLTAQVENGLVRLLFNSIPTEQKLRIFRTDGNGASAMIANSYGSHYPGNVEFVDIPSAAGTYTYYIEMDYQDTNGETQTQQSNEASVTIAEPESEEKMAQNYGFIMGRIECDKNPPTNGLKVTFSDTETTVSARQTIFSRYDIPVGTELTMTVSGDNSHKYEATSIQVRPGLNTVTIKGTYKEEYQPNEEEFDLTYSYDFKVVRENGEYHAQFVVKNNSDYPWRGYICIEATPQYRGLNLFRSKPVYKGKTYYDEIATQKFTTKPVYQTVDIVLEGLEPLDEDTEFRFEFKSFGNWKRDGVLDIPQEKPLVMADPHDYFPVKATVKAGGKKFEKWNNDAKEAFADMMVALSSLTPGMDGMVGNLMPYKEKILAITKREDLFEWIKGKSALEAINDPDEYNISSAIIGIVKDVMSSWHNSFVKKYYKRIVGNVADELSASVMLKGMGSLFTMIKEETQTTENCFNTSMACASMLYQLASIGNAVPLTSMMFTYQVVGESLINAARGFGEIENGRYILGRLKANKEYTGDEEGRVNTTTDFKLIVNRVTKYGNIKPIDFSDSDAFKQIKDIRIKADTYYGRFPAEFTFTLVPQKDCIMLKTDGKGITGGNFFVDDENGIKALYMEINWTNERQTIIPIGENTNGVKINENKTTIQTHEYENYKPLDFTVTLTTTTGTDNIADELYLGSNKERK